eukprot:COSAG02_NODE_9190_length_2296_cov_1.956759_1_plen_56_part_00
MPGPVETPVSAVGSGPPDLAALPRASGSTTRPVELSAARSFADRDGGRDGGAASA